MNGQWVYVGSPSGFNGEGGAAQVRGGTHSVQARAHRALIQCCLAMLPLVIVLGGNSHAASSITTGNTKNDNGEVQYTLKEDRFSLKLPVIKLAKGTTAEAKADRISEAINTITNQEAGWLSSVVGGTTVSITHNGKPIDSITEVEDTTGEVKTFAFGLPSTGATYAYGLPSTLAAAGIDGNGDPAYALIGTPLGQVQVAITAGEPTLMIINDLVTALLIEGVALNRTGLTSFNIMEAGSDTFATFQTSDMNLPEEAQAQAIPEPASWLLMAPGLIGLVGYGWRRGKKAV